MPALPYPKNEFITKVIERIEANLGDENFGVEELAEQIFISRSSLLRKVKSITGISVAVLIREIRLYHAKEMLQDSTISVSEIAFKVGFNSTSYFTKCFREQFGYPPGEESQRKWEDSENSDEDESLSKINNLKASGIPDYEYDIFISYRQNDNQEGWVSGFVDALKRELRATLKNEINIYFDKNPYDGLSEHHEVDASLKEKLNCYIFIPIISQTYCDPNSFAWQQEFKTFLEIAGNDEYGLKTKLANGNIASRVLPVRIHDLDSKDVTLFESEFGSTMRPIDFVYKETGVNRPLLPNDDRKQNLEKTDYRNQVNKVANAVKDILKSLNGKSFLEEPATLSHEKSNEGTVDQSIAKKMRIPLIVMSLVIIGLLAIFLVYPKIKERFRVDPVLEKTIAVLPFKNDSNDTTNIYIINGLMEAVISDLSKIEDLEVTSRTSVEKYRKISKTIPEMASELEVSYFVEGSGQKIGDQILLTVQLIEAKTDKHLWSARFERETKDIFKLQSEIAKSIAKEIEAVITPEEIERIEKVPTENMIAYDYYLKGLEQTKLETYEGLLDAISNFKKAISEDDTFANPYAYIAICYYYLDLYQMNKKYGLEINTYADKALFLESELPESQIAKALYYMQEEQYELAIPYFERVLNYAPSSAWVHNFLSDIYNSYLPNTQKYLIHALSGIKAAVASQDSVTASYTYLHLSNALAQSGFIDEAEKNILKSLRYNPDNLYSDYLYVYIKMAKSLDLEKAKDELVAILKKDTTRVDVIQEVAKIFYTLEDYENAWFYYKKFIDLKEKFDLDVFPGEDIKIAYSLKKLARDEEAEIYLSRYLAYAQTDESIYKELSLTAYYAVINDIETAISYFKTFSSHKNYQYWFVLLIEKDPIISEMNKHPEYGDILEKINKNFQTGYEETRKMLVKEGVIGD